MCVMNYYHAFMSRELLMYSEACLGYRINYAANCVIFTQKICGCG